MAHKELPHGPPKSFALFKFKQYYKFLQSVLPQILHLEWGAKHLYIYKNRSHPKPNSNFLEREPMAHNLIQKSNQLVGWSVDPPINSSLHWWRVGRWPPPWQGAPHSNFGTLTMLICDCQVYNTWDLKEKAWTIKGDQVWVTINGTRVQWEPSPWGGHKTRRAPTFYLM